MTAPFAAPTSVSLGDPAPWFSARSLAGGELHLHVNAGRWVVLSFFPELSSPRAQEEFRALVTQLAAVTEEKMIGYAVLATPADNLAGLLTEPVPSLRLVVDYDGAVTRLYGAKELPRTVVLDPMLRAIAIVPWNHPNGHAVVLAQILGSLPEADLAAGAPITAPALIVPRVFDFDLCDFLVRLYDKMGGEDSGFLLDSEGKTGTVVDHRLKRRRDLPIVVPELRERMRVPIVKRLLPAIERYFQFSATRMDRYLVSCYDSNEGGYFHRHRDNLNAGAEHRRFAVSINLNRDYDGCDLIFPEFGRRAYRAPVGGAMVFSCGALHEVTPVTRGRRYAFVPFLYGEEDAAKRLSNNSKIAAGSARYTVGDDFLYPERQAPANAAE
jgi:peroxiredoxin